MFEAHVNKTPKKILSENELSQEYGIILVGKPDKKRELNSHNSVEEHLDCEMLSVFGSYLGVKKLMNI